MYVGRTSDHPSTPSKPAENHASRSFRCFQMVPPVEGLILPIVRRAGWYRQDRPPARAFGGAMILGIHSFEKLIEVYGEQGARNLASLARSKLMLATADLDTAEQCARYIGNREVRQMDEAYSYGYNNTRDASTLTPRKQVEPLVIADDITNLPSMHGFVKFPDGFPAARIQLQWKDYPQVAQGFIARPNLQPARSPRWPRSTKSTACPPPPTVNC